MFLIRGVMFLPLVRNGTPPGPYVNPALIALMVVGLVLSLRGARRAAA